MNITIALDAEQSDAADSLRAQYALDTKAENLTLEAYFALVLFGVVEGERRRLFKITADALVKGAEALPYASRRALVSQVEAQLKP